MAAKTVEDPSGCHIWTGTTRKSGNLVYGLIWFDGRNHSAHRIALVLAGQPDPGKDTLCVNPEHLEWVTGRVNTLRSNNPCAQNARKTHCKRGHELSGHNLRINSKGERICRECERARALRYYHKRKAAPACPECNETGVDPMDPGERCIICKGAPPTGTIGATP